MFSKFTHDQFIQYHEAKSYFTKNLALLEDAELYLSNIIFDILNYNIHEIVSDYNEASFLFPFWKNYPPEDRGKKPVMDQYPWIEVGEHSIGCKLSRYLENIFSIKDIGFPTGADQRFLLSNDNIARIFKEYTRNVWLFIDIKSVGPRDDQHHAVMSHNQVSGDGNWDNEFDGMYNSVLLAKGARRSHEFYCSIPPIIVLSNGNIAPLITMALKPVYKMLPSTVNNERNGGQTLSRIDIISIPNGLLLTQEPYHYLRKEPHLFFPGKDDSFKNIKKKRARIDFERLAKLNDWRWKTISINT